jgi:hypothetical protein
MARTKQAAKKVATPKKIASAKKVAAGRKAAAKKIRSPKKITDNVCKQTVVNPQTNRCVRVGGRKYNQLKNAGIISDGKALTAVVKDAVIAQKSPAKLLEKKYKAANKSATKKNRAGRPKKVKGAKKSQKKTKKSPAKRAIKK